MNIPMSSVSGTDVPVTNPKMMISHVLYDDPRHTKFIKLILPINNNVFLKRYLLKINFRVTTDSQLTIPSLDHGSRKRRIRDAA